MTSSLAPRAGEDPGHVALEEVDDGQAETAGVVPGGVLEEVEEGDGPGQAPGVRFVRVDGVLFAIDQVGHKSIIAFFRPASSIRRAAESFGLRLRLGPR